MRLYVNERVCLCGNVCVCVFVCVFANVCSELPKKKDCVSDVEGSLYYFIVLLIPAMGEPI